MELEPARIDFDPAVDRRHAIPEPLPVRLVAVADVHLPAAAGLETDLDDFYPKLLGMPRATGTPALTYHTDNADLIFDVLEPPITRRDLRAVGIEIPSLDEVAHELTRRQTPYTRQRGIAPGEEILVLQDPAGNWIEIAEFRRIL